MGSPGSKEIASRTTTPGGPDARLPTEKVTVKSMASKSTQNVGPDSRPSDAAPANRQKILTVKPWALGLAMACTA